MNKHFPYQIICTDWHKDKSALAHIRERVFIFEQQVPAEDEWDGKDENAIHFLVRSDIGADVGCARLLLENFNNQAVFHIGRVAVVPEHRHQGVGRALMHNVVQYCLHQTKRLPIYLHAQTERQCFYEQLDFIATGDVFMDAGIAHIEMWYKSLPKIDLLHR